MTTSSLVDRLRLTAKVRGLKPSMRALLEEAADEVEEHDTSFELRWKADMRAIKRWQEAHPHRGLVWPDHADLCVWLLEQLNLRPAAKVAGPASPRRAAEDDPPSPE